MAEMRGGRVDRIRDYRDKARVLRQIMSNKSRRYTRINAAQNILTVVLTSLLGFIGFAGIDRIHNFLGTGSATTKLQLEMYFNFVVFGLFVLATLHLVFRFGEKKSEADTAIVNLTQVINHVDDLLAKEEWGEILGLSDLESVRYRYDVVTQGIPANSDGDFLRAKRDVEEKKRQTAQLTLSSQSLFDEAARIRAIKSLIHKSEDAMRVLTALQATDSRLFLGGGLVRNLVWDHLHAFKNPTPVDDVDVMYFDQLSVTKEHDRVIEASLHNRVRNLLWSVKNQARMHLSNGDEPYVSFDDAVSKWPETATCIAVRLNASGELELIAPHGLSDLFRLLVRPTANFLHRPQRIEERVTGKQWKRTWSNLEVILPSLANSEA
ncbi:MAG: nucleotidyltransferase family protein [Cytophagaceae bacterium]|nr:MAG: nucleotidyltransferase family protein [Cytophagaceae bacterium]